MDGGHLHLLRYDLPENMSIERNMIEDENDNENVDHIVK